MKRTRVVACTAALLCAMACALPAQSREERGVAREAHFDGRYQHNRSYPERGFVTRELPGGAIAVNQFDHRYWYAGGVWYGPYGGRWIVVAPPIGVFVPFLPAFYTTVWFGGIPYYYANDAYYVWQDSGHGYEVVDPPPGAIASTEGPPTQDLFLYPRNGQSAEQQGRDRYECHRWAADQTGFDPTQPLGGVPGEEARGKRGEYQRAMTACLEGRGYSVK
jgi:hypothetical protein